MTKEHLQVTITSKKFKTKFGQWWYKKISWPWHCWIIKRKAKFYGALYNFFYKHASPEKRQEMDDFNNDAYENMKIFVDDSENFNIQEIMDNIKKDRENEEMGI